MQTLLLLHGALGSNDQFAELEVQLAGKFVTYAINFQGHGGAPFKETEFSIESFAEEAADYIDSLNVSETGRINVFGYSMGGYAAMRLAHKYPEKIRAVCTLATKFYWDKETAEKESAMLNPDKIQAKLPAYAEALAKRHKPGDWKKLLQLTTEILNKLGEKNLLSTADYQSIMVPVLIMLGDRDKMVTIEETIKVYKSLPAGNLAILPGTPHPFEQLDIKMLVSQLEHFLLNPVFGDM